MTPPPVLTEPPVAPALLATAYSLLVQKSSDRFGMNQPLLELLRDLPVRATAGDLRAVVSSLCTDSRRAAPGALFFALHGHRQDGNLYIEEAVHRGASAIVSDSPGHVPRAAYVQVDRIREVLAEVARRFYGHPERALQVHGVTGTNGKTTVTTLLKHFLEEPSSPVGLIGTVHYLLGRRSLPAHRTTPDAAEIQGLLAQMREAGCTRAVMEVSSHGIDQHRVQFLPFRAVAFTNLTQDHLDYHHTLEAYFEVKSRLFTGGTGALPGAAVINLDDPWGRRLRALVPPGVTTLTVGEDPAADFRAEQVELGPRGTRFHLRHPGGRCAFHSPLLGHYNVSNVLVALALASLDGRPPETLRERLLDFPGVPGRMERIDLGQPYNVLVDYAHTDDALRNALAMLRAITPGRLRVVFGCGGNRDRAKRPLMTRAVLEGSDQAFATADNPRGETLAQIFADMRAGLDDPARLTFIEDRRRAISLALDECRPGDTLLIAGKGHETYQEFADSVAPFDDRLVARELLHLKQLRPPPPAAS